jgi:hypothetical protein
MRDKTRLRKIGAYDFPYAYSGELAADFGELRLHHHRTRKDG